MDKKMADRLAEYRRKSGLSQDELAEKLDVLGKRLVIGSVVKNRPIPITY